MDALVVLSNPKNRLMAARNRRGEYTIFESEDDTKIMKGDLLSGKFDSIGLQKVVNLTQKKLLSIYIRYENKMVASKAKEIVNAS